MSFFTKRFTSNNCKIHLKQKNIQNKDIKIVNIYIIWINPYLFLYHTILSPFQRWGNWETKRLNNLTNATLVIGWSSGSPSLETKLWTQSSFFLCQSTLFSFSPLFSIIIKALAQSKGNKYLNEWVNECSILPLLKAQIIP